VAAEPGTGKQSGALLTVPRSSSGKAFASKSNAERSAQDVKDNAGKADDS
jgi:hypothetical protein